jgi:hypothetical protein
MNQELYHKLKLTEGQLQETQEKLEASLYANRMLTKQLEELRRKHHGVLRDNHALTSANRALMAQI